MFRDFVYLNQFNNQLSDDEYSRALAIDGSTTPCDVSSDFEMKLPSYVDHEKIARYL